MNRLDPILKVTLELKMLLEQDISAKNRESFIAEISRIIENREQLLKRIVPPYSDSEKRTGKQLVRLNELIQKNLNALFTELKKEMKQLKKQKKSNRTYTNPYKNLQTVDGMFMDSKK